MDGQSLTQRHTEFDQALGDNEGQGMACCSSSKQSIRHDLAAEQQQQDIH